MSVISVINAKGGVGKTTVTANLAAQWGYLGKRVLVVDLDPQASLTLSFLSYNNYKSLAKMTIKEWFDAIIYSRKTIPSLKQLVSKVGPIDFIFSDLALPEIDLALTVGLSSTSPAQYQSNFLKVHSLLINELPHLRPDYDVIIFDCPPNFNIVSRNAVLASDYYLLPSKMDQLSIIGLPYIFNQISTQVKRYNQYAAYFKIPEVSPALLGVVATMISYNNQGAPIGAQQSAMASLAQQKLHLFPAKIRESKDAFAKAAETKVPVVLNKNAGSKTVRMVVEELELLAEQIAQKIGI